MLNVMQNAMPNRKPWAQTHGVSRRFRLEPIFKRDANWSDEFLRGFIVFGSGVLQAVAIRFCVFLTGRSGRRKSGKRNIERPTSNFEHRKLTMKIFPFRKSLRLCKMKQEHRKYQEMKMATMMKGVVLPGNRTVETREFPVPTPGA